MIGVQNLARKHKVAIRMDFSDPQGGKGPCDRKAAVLKNHMREIFSKIFVATKTPRLWKTPVRSGERNFS